MHVGVWGLAAIVVVIVSWLMYRYLAPKSWKEWTRAGVLQAFIIAFCAEMYGRTRPYTPSVEAPLRLTSAGRPVTARIAGAAQRPVLRLPGWRR